MITQFHYISKEKFRGALTNENLTGISVLNTKETILKKINISFIVHFCLGKHDFRLGKNMNLFLLFFAPSYESKLEQTELFTV